MRRKRRLHIDKAKLDLLKYAKSGYLTAFVDVLTNRGLNEKEMRQVLNWPYGGRNETILHIAAKHDHEEIISWLLSNEQGKGRQLGFNSFVAKRSNETALHVAALRRSSNTFFAIIDGCINDDEKRELLRAVENGRFTVLHLAVFNPSVISWLLSNEKGKGRQSGFNLVTARDSLFGRTALHSIVAYGAADSYRALMNGCTEEEKREIFNAVDNEGRTVLHFAASATYTDAMIHFLHVSSVQKCINAQDLFGMTPLHFSVIGIMAVVCPHIMISLAPAECNSIDNVKALLSQEDLDPNIGIYMIEWIDGEKKK